MRCCCCFQTIIRLSNFERQFLSVSSLFSSLSDYFFVSSFLRFVFFTFSSCGKCRNFMHFSLRHTKFHFLRVFPEVRKLFQFYNGLQTKFAFDLSSRFVQPSELSVPKSTKVFEALYFCLPNPNVKFEVQRFSICQMFVQNLSTGGRNSMSNFTLVEIGRTVCSVAHNSPAAWRSGVFTKLSSVMTLTSSNCQRRQAPFRQTASCVQCILY
jgi:hypothetical protein